MDTWQALPGALQATGLNEDEIGAVLGGNMARVAGQVWGTGAP